jgi:hypothetical protein
MIRADQLHVVSVISNPVRYASRPRLARLVQDHQADAGVVQYVVEATLGEREPEVATRHDPRHLVVRCDDEIWLKENLINMAVRWLLPADWRYVMWMDADFTFCRPDWASETVHALQHWQVVQPFSHAVDLGPDHEIIETNQGFAYLYNKGLEAGDARYPFFHPGYAWAWRREAWDAVGGMIERAVTGAADHHMACGLIGRPEISMPDGLSPAYVKMVADWTQRAEVGIRRDVGHVPGTILHRFHGWKEDRDYQGRWQILTSTGFDPDTDLAADARGLLHLNPDRTYLRDQLRGYFRRRNEDQGRRSWPA